MNVERQIDFLTKNGHDLTGRCIVRIYTTLGTCREFLVNSVEYAEARVEKYKKWKYFAGSTIAVYVGMCWEEVC